MKLTCMLTPQLNYEDESEPDAKELVYYLKLLREQDAEIGISATRLSDTDISSKLKQDAAFLTGRLGNNLLVHFKGDPSLIGKIVRVKLTECKGFYYMGHAI